MNIFTIILLKLIKGYQFLISPIIGNSCRYFPTCSEYSLEALSTCGVFKVDFISLKRILTCNTIKCLDGSEGYDRVSNKTKIKNKGHQERWIQQ